MRRKAKKRGRGKQKRGVKKRRGKMRKPGKARGKMVGKTHQEAGNVQGRKSSIVPN